MLYPFVRNKLVTTVAPVNVLLRQFSSDNLQWTNEQTEEIDHLKVKVANPPFWFYQAIIPQRLVWVLRYYIGPRDVFAGTGEVCSSKEGTNA